MTLAETQRAEECAASTSTIVLFDMNVRVAVYGASIVLLAVGLFCPDVRAQRSPQFSAGAYSVVYRPESADYRVLERGRFDYIYQVGTDDMVRRTARALEESWSRTDSLVGPVVDDFHMPVVINNYNDLSNGFVHAFPFRQEIEAPSIKSDPLVARSSSWPALVAPHELVHAAHAEVDGGFGIGSLIRPFAPDMAREINLLAPRGLTEGIAVYRESHYESGAGRLNAPRFQMKMKAAMTSDDPWSLTQMLEPPAYTQPFNRFYIGGANAFQYLAERSDSVSTRFFQSAVTWHNRLPMFGHGVWLGLSTNRFPWQLGTEIQSALRETYQAELDRRKPFTSSVLVSGEAGLNHRRPYWLDGETLVAYVEGYDARPGFYRIDAETGERNAIRIQELTEDRVYSLGPDTTALYAARYVQDSFVLRQEIAEIERIDLPHGTVTQLTDEGRALAPAPGEDGTVYAATNHGPFTRLAKVTETDSTVSLVPDAPRSVRQIAPSPRTSTLAVLMNEKGQQRVYRAREPLSKPVQLTPWFGLKGAIIYDMSWGPEGRYLLFSADLGGTPNAYAYDVDTDTVLQLTNVPFGALEPALSPDRSTIAFVNYRHERYDLVRMSFRPDSAHVVPDSLVRRHFSGFELSTVETSTEAGDSVDISASRSYSAWRYMAPRMIYPTLHGQGDEEPLPYLEAPGTGALGIGVGLGMQGADPLQRWAYRTSTYWQEGRFWGEAHLQNGAFLFRPSLSLYDRAFSALARVGGRRRSVHVEERGGSLGVRLPVILESNVYQSSLRLELETEVRQTRFFGVPFPQPTKYSTRITLSPEAVFGYRLQQNPRDLVPNTGVVLGVRGEVDAWSEDAPTSEGLIASLDAYLPVLRSSHTGFRVGLRALFQNRESIFNPGTFVPRGYSSVRRLPSGPFLQFEAEVTQPLWYIDDGLTLFPFYAKALSVYGFGETLGQVEEGRWQRTLSSVGGGFSLQCRLFYGFALDLRLGIAYRPETGETVTIYR